MFGLVSEFIARSAVLLGIRLGLRTHADEGAEGMIIHTDFVVN